MDPAAAFILFAGFIAHTDDKVTRQKSNKDKNDILMGYISLISCQLIRAQTLSWLRLELGMQTVDRSYYARAECVDFGKWEKRANPT